MNPHIMSGAHTRGNRNFGLEGAGKGDGDRTTDKQAFDENLAEVKFSGVPASQDPTFVKSKRGYKKVFGAQEVKPLPIDDTPAELPVPAQPYEVDAQEDHAILTDTDGAGRAEGQSES